MTTTIDGSNESTFAAGVTCTSLNGGQLAGRRNIVINGGMKVAQRSTSVTGLGATTGYYVLDRFRTPMSTSGRFTMAQVADGPAGFAKCMKITTTTADTSIAATELLIFEQRIEGQDVQQLQKGTATAKQVTVSFYVKGNAAATYVCELYDHDNTRNITQSFTVTTDWRRIELTFAADTSDPLDDDNAVSLSANIWLHAGSNRTSGTFVSNTWADVNETNRCAVSNFTSIFDSTNRTFFLTGVQVELGSTATEFEHRSYGEELALCQRYLPAFNAESTTDTFATGTFTSNAIAFINYPFLVEPRVTPTGITISTVAHVQLYGPGGGTSAASGFIFNGGTCKKLGRLQVNGTGTPYTPGQGAEVFSNDATLQLLWTGCEL